MEFTINYKTDFGNEICIIGEGESLGKNSELYKNILGNWKVPKKFLKWTEVSNVRTLKFCREIIGRSQLR